MQQQQTLQQDSQLVWGQCQSLGAGDQGPNTGAIQGVAVQMSNPVLRCTPDPDFEKVASKLHRVLTGSKFDERECFAVLCNKSVAQALSVEASFRKLYGESLVKKIESAFSGVARKFMKCLFYDHRSADAYWLCYSMKGLGTQDDLLIDLMTSRTYKELCGVSDVFRTVYGKDLAKTIRGDTSGDYCTFLLSLLETKCEDDDAIDFARFSAELAVLTKRLKGVSFGHEFVIELLTSSSDVHLCSLDKVLQKVSGKSLAETLKEELHSGSFSKAVTACVEFKLTKLGTFARRLKSAMDCNDELTVAVMLTTRREVDLYSILEEYEKISEISFAVDLLAKPDTTFWVAVKVFVFH